MNEVLDFEWIAAQAGVPVSFLNGIPIFFAVVLTLASMIGNKEPENYQIGRHAEVKRNNAWVAPAGLFVLIAVALINYEKFFVPH